MNEIAELRVLVFSYTDIKKALDKSAEQHTLNVPQNDICEVHTSSRDGEREFTVIFKNPPGMQIKGLSLSEFKLIECLICLCIERKIPIPRNASKKLEVNTSSIAMWINSGETEEVSKSDKFKDIINE